MYSGHGMGRKTLPFVGEKKWMDLAVRVKRVMLIHPFHPVSPFLTLRGRVGKGMVSGGGENFNPVVPS